jgi:hypothetical protein
MTYRRRKISLKERLEEAIEEIGGSRCKVQDSSVKRQQKSSARLNLVLSSFASSTVKTTVGTRYRPV